MLLGARHHCINVFEYIIDLRDWTKAHAEEDEALQALGLL